MRKYNTNFIKTLEKLDKECELNSANRNFAISQIKRAFGLITEKEMLDTIHLFSNLAEVYGLILLTFGYKEEMEDVKELASRLKLDEHANLKFLEEKEEGYE